MHLKVWKRISQPRVIASVDAEVAATITGPEEDPFPLDFRSFDLECGLAPLEVERTYSRQAATTPMGPREAETAAGRAVVSQTTYTQTHAGSCPEPSRALRRLTTKIDATARFRLVEKVHHGSLSTVWRAFDNVRQGQVAVKLMPQNLAPALDAPALAHLEQVSARPELVTLIEHGWEGRWWYQVAEWIDGKALSLVHRQQSVRADYASHLAVWMKQVAAGLSAQHSAGFVHGDVKPSNVLITEAGACLIDIAGLQIGASWSRHFGLTPAYASPEARLGSPADPRDDVYSLAAMIYKLLSGKTVPEERTPNDLWPPPGGLTASQWRILSGALEPERSQRIGSAVQLVDALWPEPALPARPALPRRAAVNGGARSTHRRRRSVAGAFAGKAAISTAIAILVVAGIEQDDIARQLRLGFPANGPEVREAQTALPIASAAAPLQGVVEAARAAASELMPATPIGVAANRATRATGGAAGAPFGAALAAERTAARSEPAFSTAAASTGPGLVARPARSNASAAPRRADVAAALADRSDVQSMIATRKTTYASRGASAGGTSVAVRAMPASFRVNTAASPFDDDGGAAVKFGTASPLSRVERGSSSARPLDRDKHDATGRPDLALREDALAARPEKPEPHAGGERPEAVARPATFERPVRVERVEKPERAERVERIDRPEKVERFERVVDRPERAERPEKLDRAEKVERPERLDRPDKPDRPEKMDRPDKPERPQVLERPERPEAVARIERPEKPERPEKAERPERPEMARPEKLERPEKPERPEKVERPDKPERPEKAERPEKPERPEKVDRPARPERPEKPERPK